MAKASAWLEGKGIDGSTAAFGVAFFLLGALLSVLLTGYLLLRIPSDYFQRDAEAGKGTLRRIGKNTLGVLLVALGLVLSIPGVPGQGLLTILLGVILLDVPGKRRFELAIVRRRGVLAAVNRLRLRFGREPLVVP